MRVVYLHGFASSPQSSKALYFSRRLRDAGVAVDVPQLDGGSFETLTVSGQLTVIQESVARQPAPVVLMGSSLGGYLAALYAARHPEEVERLILLAPAFRFFERWTERMSGEQQAHWKTAGKIDFFHYGNKKPQSLRYQFVEDAAQYEGEPAFPQPTLILHGIADETVPVAGSRRLAAERANIHLETFQSGHELTDVTDHLWEHVALFLDLPNSKKEH